MKCRLLCLPLVRALTQLAAKRHVQQMLVLGFQNGVHYFLLHQRGLLSAYRASAISKKEAVVSALPVSTMNKRNMRCSFFNNVGQQYFYKLYFTSVPVGAPRTTRHLCSSPKVEQPVLPELRLKTFIYLAKNTNFTNLTSDHELTTSRDALRTYSHLQDHSYQASRGEVGYSIKPLERRIGSANRPEAEQDLQASKMWPNRSIMISDKQECGCILTADKLSRLLFSNDVLPG